MPTSTQLVTFKTQIDVLDAARAPQRIHILADALIPVVYGVERAATVVDMAYDRAPQTTELFGIEGAAFRGFRNHVGVEPSPETDVIDLAGGRIYAMLPERHSITGGKIAKIRSGVVGRWNGAELADYDLGVAKPRVEALQRAAAENLRIHEGRLFHRTKMPIWHADLARGIVWAMETRWANYSACPSTTFGAGRLDEAVRMVREVAGLDPEIRGQITGYDPRFDVPETVRVGREAGEWLARMTADEVVALPGELVRGWRHLRDAGADRGPMSSESGLQLVGDAAAYAEAVLDRPDLRISDAGNSRGRLFRGFVEACLTTLKWRLDAFENPQDAVQHHPRGPGA